MSNQPVLIDGRWRAATAQSTFQSENPAAASSLDETFPVSTWEDCEAALAAAQRAAAQLRQSSPEQIARFLERYADLIDEHQADLAATAHTETALPVSPRLADVEIPRTSNQLRSAATAAREGSWTQATIDTATGIRAYFAGIGPVCVMGPNNFPFAFNSIAGGDFAAALAAGNPVIAKANSSHPATTGKLAVLAQQAAEEAELPAGTIQLLYRLDHADGERLVADARIGATGYTGSRSAGLALKAAADAAGKPIYLELSSINPVVVLPGALSERGEALADEFTGSCLMGTGQFCTNPGMVLLLAGDATEQFIEQVTARFGKAAVGTLLSSAVARSMQQGIAALREAGAEVLVGGESGGGSGYSNQNTLLRTSAAHFLNDPEKLQTEVFGNASLLVVADDAQQAAAVLDQLEGNLTGCVYSDTQGSDDTLYDQLVPHLRAKVGRLLNDKMPTGVAVSPAMNHGGPYPATGHPGFTAVGIPAALVRFAMLQCFDNVRPHRLPWLLRDKNPSGAWRSIDGTWTREDVGT